MICLDSGQQRSAAYFSGFDGANFGARAGAMMIDCVLLVSLWLFFLVALGGAFLRLLPMDLSLIIISALIYLLLAVTVPILGSMAYFTVFLALDGQTPGKMIMGIRVVSSDSERISPGLAFLRMIGYVISFLPLLAGFLWMLWDREQRAWHDSLAVTRVIVTQKIT